MFSFATSVVPCAIKIKTDTGVSQLGFVRFWYVAPGIGPVALQPVTVAASEFSTPQYAGL